MKIIKKIFNSVVLLLICNIAFGNTDTRDSIIIEGVFIDSTLAEDGLFEVTVMQPNAKMAWPSYSDVYRVNASKGKFRLTIPAESNLFYASLAKGKGNTRDKLLYYSGLEAVFLFQPGDHITLKINKDNTLRFEGKGTEKMLCQQKIYQAGAIAEAFQSRIIELNNAKDFQELYDCILPFYINSWQAKLDILNSYKSLDTIVRKRILADCYGLTFHQFYKDFALLINRDKRPFALDFWKNKLALLPNYPSNSESPLSYYLPQMLYSRSLAAVRFTNNHAKDIPYNELYKLIKDNYSGALRDQISLVSLFEYSNRVKILDDAQKVLNEMEFNQSQKMLQEWIGKSKTGNPAFNFALKDVKGNLVRLGDFKGKVLILDFWYYGCFGCRFMPEALKPVVAAFKGNKSVVFLSVNVDQVQSRWENGLKSGDYTLKEQIDISTAPMGFYHPFLKHYNYKAFPQVLVIDKDGNNVASNPPDPRGVKGVEKLIAMIKEALGN